jgi:predicted nucleic acid-binding protein
LTARLKQPMPAIDGLIAATALRHRLTVVTRNVGDFARAGVDILDPWQA